MRDQGNTIGSVCVSLLVITLRAQPLEEWTQNLVLICTLTMPLMNSMVKVIGQRCDVIWCCDIDAITSRNDTSCVKELKCMRWEMHERWASQVESRRVIVEALDMAALSMRCTALGLWFMMDTCICCTLRGLWLALSFGLAPDRAIVDVMAYSAYGLSASCIECETWWVQVKPTLSVSHGECKPHAVLSHSKCWHSRCKSVTV